MHRATCVSVMALLSTACATTGPAAPGGAPVTVAMAILDDQGGSKPAGTVALADSAYGLVLTPQLAGIKPGLHGFHVHENPSCAVADKDGKPTAGQAAGGHLDPAKTGKHGTPWGDGHLGDLPPIHFNAERKAAQPVLAPRLKLADVRGRSLMIHAGGDNHADHPAPLGGGGGRIACGVVPAQ